MVSDSAIRLAQRGELVVLAVAVPVLLVCARRALRPSGIEAARAWPGALAVAAIALLRGTVTRFSLVHANFHATGILDAMYAEPLRSVRNYGVFHSLVYGGVMHLLGPRLEAVAWTNEIFAATTLLLMAFLAARYTGSRYAGLLVLAIGLLDPVVLRMAGSEEGHNLAVLLAFVALALLEGYVTDPRREWLVAAAGAAILMVDVKQIAVGFLPCLVAIGWARAPKERRWPILVVLGAAVLPMLALRAIGTLGDSATYNLSRRLDPGTLALALMTHPLLDHRGPIYLLLPLLGVGLVWTARRVRGGWGIVGSFAWLFLSSLWLFEGQAVVFTFRLPVIALAQVIAGMGAYAIATAAAGRDRRLGSSKGPAVALALALAGAPLVQPGFRVVREVSSQTREYVYLRELAASWPARSTIVIEHTREPLPSYEFPEHLFPTARVVFLEHLAPGDFLDGPVFFLVGLQCRAYALDETGITRRDPRTLSPVLPPELGAFPEFDPATIPTRPRRFCTALEAHGKPYGTPRTIETPRQLDSPFALYGSDTTEITFYELDASAVQVSAAPLSFEPDAP